MSELFAVKLTAAELVMLDGHVRPEVQSEVDIAKSALRLAAAAHDLNDAQRKLVAEAVAEAKTNGALIYRGKSIRYCELCGKSAGYAPYKSGYNRGLPNHNKPRYMGGYELASRFVTVQGYPTLGGCSDCIHKLLHALRSELDGVRAELPKELRTESSPAMTRWPSVECTKCGWHGHEGELRELNAVMGGKYRGGCPECPAENTFLGPLLIKRDSKKFVVVEASP